MACSISSNPFIINVKCFSNCNKFCLSFFVISFTRFCGDIFDNSIIVSIIFFGNNSSKLFLNCLFLNSLKSLKSRLSSISSSNDGFKSICNIILFSFSKFSMFLTLNKWAELLKIIGPDTPWMCKYHFTKILIYYFTIFTI